MKNKKILPLFNLLFLGFSLLMGQGKTPCDLFEQLNKDLSAIPNLFSILEVPAIKKAYDLLKKASQDFRTNQDNIKKLVDDLASSTSEFEAIINTEGVIKAWKKILSSTDDCIKELRTNPTQLQKFTDIIANDNLGLNEAKLFELLNAAAAKGLKWDFPKNILEVVKRPSDANIPGLKVSHKKFPELAGTGGGYLLPAKIYQKAASGDANLSFEVGGRSRDDIGADGKLIDRRFGYGNSIFNKIEDEFGEVLLDVANETRIKAVLRQAKGQIQAANGKPIRWEISNQTGADGINGDFNGTIGNCIIDQEFVGVAFNTIEVVFKP